MIDSVYLDYNATTPIDEEVADAMIPLLKGNFGNPSSLHHYGIEAKKEIEKARTRMANLINSKAHEIIFTSGGTESNNLALKGVAFAKKTEGNHIITSSIEHPAVLEVCKSLESDGFEISLLKVDKYGIIDPEELKSALRKETILVSIMHANNEVGSIQPIAEISKILKSTNIIFHCDAAQSPGKIKVDVEEMGIDLLSIAGHKFYGPKGVGVLYIREGTKISKLMHGANHEQNIRPGTENILEIAGIGKAAELAGTHLDKNSFNMKRTRDLLHQKIQQEFPETVLNGHPESRLPNTLNLSFPGVDVSLLLSAMKKVAASAGAACHAEEITYSHVLKAMDISPEMALGTIRLSTGKNTSEEEIEFASREIIQKIKDIQSPQNEKIISIQKEKIKLTEYTHGLGCACKISPKVLNEVLKNFPVPSHPDILLGPETSDDAAVYRINSDTAIVQSVDFFTPVIDDPFQFGAIAAANALSDIYAMGAKALFGLNIVGFPVGRLPLHVLTEILQGAREVCDEAGISILGGHTIEDNEPKFGMVITGVVHPEKIITNAGAKEGDALILTKPIGTGIYSTALKRGILEDNQKEILFENMRSLNKTASEIMIKYDISACTDITGFGLTGHLNELCKASGVGADILFSKIPFLPDVISLASQGYIPGGTENNLSHVNPFVNWDTSITDIQKKVLADAQTSGGLLISLAFQKADKLRVELEKKGISAKIIGNLIVGKGLHIKS